MKTLILKRKALALSLTLATVLALAFTQCKKEETHAVTPNDDTTETPTNAPILPQGETVHITLKVNQSNDTKLEVNPPHVNFENGDTLYVASNGVYVGYLLYDGNNSEFGGTITGATAGQPLYFYLLGNRGVNGISWTVANEVTTGCSLDISNQFDYFAGQPAEKQRPVVSCAPSNENYGETTDFTAILCNQCALVKFNTNVISGTVTLGNMYNKANVNFSGNTITPATTTGSISFATDANGVGWTILLPHDGAITSTASAAGYDDTSVTIPAININDYLSGGIEVNLFSAIASPLTFEAKEAGATVTFDICTSAATNPVYYSTDNGESWPTYSSGTAITLANIGDKVMFQGDNATYANLYTSDYSHFSCTGECYVYGNIMSLIDADDYPTATELTEEFTFANIFEGNSSIYNHPTKALELPATTLTKECYSNMFYECTGLTTAPELPATTLTQWCYSSMFYECTSLTTAPELPATNLAEGCYTSMFSYCTSLKTAPDLPATTLANSCYENMFLSCTSLPTAPELPATTLANDCYSDMFRECIVLATAPELPATNLAENCYLSMFEACISLTAAPALPATTLAEGCYINMFKYCVKLETAPILPATNLVENCYSNMFYGCSLLNSVTCLATDISAWSCTYKWLYGVAATGTFTKPALTDWTEGASGIPSGWTVIPVVPGKFSVSATKKVYFSQGNLQYQASTNTWRFAENQWDFVGTQSPHNNVGDPGGTVSGSDNYDVAENYSGWIDLFSWGTSGYNHGAICYQPWSTSNEPRDHYPYGAYNKNLYDEDGRADWGYNAISNGGNTENQWRTLTKTEWNYVLNTRSTASGIRYAKAQVNNVNGIILLPDNWSSSYHSLSNTNDGTASYDGNVIDASTWTNSFEAHGVVFLPTTGIRSGSNKIINNVRVLGCYWSSEYHTLNASFAKAYVIQFNESTLFNNNQHCNNACGVRLVYDVP